MGKSHIYLQFTPEHAEDPRILSYVLVLPVKVPVVKEATGFGAGIYSDIIKTATELENYTYDK